MASADQGVLLSAYLSEFERLRTEIDARTGVLPTLLTIELAALAGGISVAVQLPDVTLGFGLVANFLWLVWLDQANQVRKIAAYISIELAPRVRAIAPGALGWEHFLRCLEAGGNVADRALRLPEGEGGTVSWSPGDVAAATTLLFGLTPPALVVVYVTVTVWDFTAVDLPRLAGAAFVLAFWLVCVRFYRRVRGTAELVTRAILAMPAGDGDGDGAPQ